jgi:hypothetical protein
VGEIVTRLGVFGKEMERGNVGSDLVGCSFLYVLDSWGSGVCGVGKCSRVGEEGWDVGQTTLKWGRLF